MHTHRHTHKVSKIKTHLAPSTKTLYLLPSLVKELPTAPRSRRSRRSRGTDNNRAKRAGTFYVVAGRFGKDSEITTSSLLLFVSGVLCYLAQSRQREQEVSDMGLKGKKCIHSRMFCWACICIHTHTHTHTHTHGRASWGRLLRFL